MSHVRDSVGTSKQGSTNALAGSGSSSMSLSLMAWKPRIDEPSNPKPSVNVSSSSSFKGIEKCCQVPGRSVNRTSTICTPASLARRITSAGDGAVDAFAPVATVGSSVAVIGWGLLPESVSRFASGGPYAEARGAKGGCQDKPAQNPKKNDRIVTFTQKLCKTYAKEPPRSATAPPPKTPRTAPEYPCPSIQGRSSQSPYEAGRSRSGFAPGPRPATYQAGLRGRRPSAARRASAPPCACRSRCQPCALHYRLS